MALGDIRPENIKKQLGSRLLTVRARPNRSKTTIVGWEKGILSIDVAAPPDKGKANVELLKFLKRFFGHPVELAGGATSREKRIRIGQT